MNNTYIGFDYLKKLYPNEWILLGNPEIKNATVLGGVVFFTAKTKKRFVTLVETKQQTFQQLLLRLQAI